MSWQRVDRWTHLLHVSRSFLGDGRTWDSDDDDDELFERSIFTRSDRTLHRPSDGSVFHVVHVDVSQGRFSLGANRPARPRIETVGGGTVSTSPWNNLQPVTAVSFASQLRARQVEFSKRRRRLKASVLQFHSAPAALRSLVCSVE